MKNSLSSRFLKIRALLRRNILWGSVTSLGGYKDDIMFCKQF